MDRDRGVGASFYATSRLNVNVHRAPNFSVGGSVTFPPNHMCVAEGTCSYEFNVIGSTNVTLTANPDPGSTFYWGQACGGSATNCTVTVGNGATTTVDLYFIPQLVLNANGPGGGRVEVLPAGNACVGGNSCLYSFPPGTVVTLIPQPNPGFTYTWGQICGGSEATCSFTVGAGTTITADVNFIPTGSASSNGVLRSVGEAVSIPSDGKPFIHGPFPNPTRDGASMRFTMHEPGPVRLDVFNVAGRRIATPVDANLKAGLYVTSWDGRTVDARSAPTGIYYMRLSIPGLVQSRPVVIAR